ncbi:MAG: FAD-dependent oxidoreductase [Peptostreptococcaceae bacterium]
MRLYKCTICNEVFEQDECPTICSVCGASEDKFIEVAKVENNFRKDTEEYILIIGNGAAGYYAADSIRKRNKTCKITMISNESELSYYRPALSDLINYEASSSFYIADKAWYEERNILTLLDTTVQKINEKEKYVTLSTGFNLKYDKLILANGSSNFIPPVKGYDLTNVFTLRNYKDLLEIKSNISSSKKAVIIGGGLLGLEAAWEFKEKGLEVVVVDISENILPRQLDKEGSLVLEKYIKEAGVELKLNSFLDYIDGNDKVEKVVFKDGSTIECDIVLFSVGVRANTSIVKDSSIKIDRGVLVNKYMETTSKNIFACGDVAQLDNMSLAIWPVAVEMGKVAGANACGDYTTFKEDVYPISLDAFNINVISIGNINDYDEVISEGDKETTYKKKFIKNEKLVGAILINNSDELVNIISKISNK